MNDRARPGCEHRTLVDYLEASAARSPDAVAVIDPDGRSATYAELHLRADALAALLTSSGVDRGDRVGVALPKSISAIVALFGIMKAGAAYVPVDITAPAERGRAILSDCHVRALIVDGAALDRFAPGSAEPIATLAAIVVVGQRAFELTAIQPRPRASNSALQSWSRRRRRGARASDLAYILYTSGSTGTPKGVALTHANAVSFVEWCTSVFAPTEADRFGSHAPFHFDLSILDVYLAIKHGAALCLVSEQIAKRPDELARYIARNAITIWYSTPSVLTMLREFGNISLQRVPSPRLVLFAGEVFPVKHLRELTKCWPSAEYYNLYGPTETNVCTFSRIPATIPDDREAPYPIGFPCSHCRARALDEHGHDASAGEEGLLHISGPSVFAGYWNRPKESAAAFVVRDGVRWYNTGDVVRWDVESGFSYVGRRDRMVKRRGFRVELDEIERALHTHPAAREVAVLSLPEPDGIVKIAVCFCCRAEVDRPSIIELKRFIAAKLPTYMSPDRFLFRDALPKTSTNKVDYRALADCFGLAARASGRGVPGGEGTAPSATDAEGTRGASSVELTSSIHGRRSPPPNC